MISTKLLVRAAVMSRVVGYAAIVVLSFRRAEAVAAYYAMILAAEAFHIAASVRIWLSKSTPTTTPSATESGAHG